MNGENALKLANGNDVVMVDDNEGDVVLTQRCFEMSRVPNPWMSFSSGPGFLAHLRLVRRGEALMPALVLLDLNMPGMSGFEVLQTTRSDPYFEQLPVFCMLTSSHDPRDKARAERYGASGYFTKTANLDEYVTFFDALL
jgi:two-component system response regulator